MANAPPPPQGGLGTSHITLAKKHCATYYSHPVLSLRSNPGPMLKTESFQLRLTQPQMQRLTEVMHATGLGKAEHIRRAVDYYLAGWRPAPSQAMPAAPDAPARAAPAASPVSQQPVPVVTTAGGGHIVSGHVKIARR